MQCRQETLNAVKRKRDEQTGSGNAEGVDAPEPVFEFTLVSRNPKRTSEKLRRTSQQNVYHVKHNLAEYVDLLEVGERIDDLFFQMVEPMLEEVDEDDLVSVEVQHEDVQNPIYMSYRKKSAFDKQQFVNSVYAVSQSNQTFLLDGLLTVEVNVVKNLKGGGRNTKKNGAPRKTTDVMKQKTSLVTISNNDQACFWRAFATCLFWQEQHTDNERRYFRRDNAQRQTKAAWPLCQKVGMDINNPVSSCDFQKIADCFPEYQLIIVGRDGKTKLFCGPKAPKEVVLEFTEDEDGDGHFNAITSLKGYMDASYFCSACWRPYSNLGKHKCEAVCKACRMVSACNSNEDLVDCDVCNRQFYGEDCYELHLKACEKHVQCPKCDVVYNSKENVDHTCFVYYCNACKLSYEDTPHYCYLQPTDEAKLALQDSKPKIYVAFDIESMQDIKVVNGVKSAEHIPNLLIAKFTCDLCLGTSGPCDLCGEKEIVYKGTDCVHDFCTYLFEDLAEEAGKEASILVFAHNFRGYDGRFVIRDLWARGIEDLDTVMNGSKLLALQTGNIKFVDSLSFIPLPLSGLPKAFGFEDLVMKGYFPHYFNTEANQNYVGPLPPKSAYGYSTFKSEAQPAFNKWYKSQKHRQFNLQEELETYCRNDVLILQKAILAFQKLIKDKTNLDPLTRCITLASVTMEIFRTKHLKPHTIAKTPDAGYCNRKRSMVGSIWLDTIEDRNPGKELLREYKIGIYYADAVIKDTKQVFEFWGCHWHGCPKCYEDRTEQVAQKDRTLTREEQYEEVQKKRAYYAKHGWTLTEIWECDYHKSRGVFHNERMGELMASKAVGPVDIKESFFGGRTNNLRFYHQVGIGEIIRYLDFTSLYPYVLKNMRYPVGHPRYITRNFKTIDNYFGFVKCKVLAPKALYIPVLPVRLHDKLMFPLCRTCAEQKQDSNCVHEDKERVLIGTWTTEELLLAEEMGYHIETIYGILHYDKTSTELFKDNMNMWIKEKQEASDWPVECVTEDQKLAYITAYAIREEVNLQYDRIEKNPGGRTNSKLFLNSLWGKLAQSNNLPKTEHVKDPARLNAIAGNEKLEVQSEVLVAPDILLVTFKFKKDEDAPQGKRNLAIASFVTSYARTMLYRLLNRIESTRPRRVLYFDTDSVIFVENETDEKIETGNYLGELTDEIPGGTCTKFVSGGPKNYGYEYTDKNGETKTVLKVKGVTLNARTQKHLNLKVMTQAVSRYFTKGAPKVVEVPQWQIASDKHTQIVQSRWYKKVYNVVSEKRRVVGNDTLPYGWFVESNLFNHCSEFAQGF
jgi:DNA polymerase type B, organellar and viral